MSRKHRKATVHGWLLLDKPLELSSNGALGRLKKLYDCPKVGHAGTLDPLATGMLPVAFGEATKTVPYVMDGRKTYRFEALWGVRTSTDDAEGEPVATSEKRPTQSEIDVALKHFTGTILQVPPQFSAIKVDGQRAYARARSGEEVEIEPREVEIHDLRRIDERDEDRLVERTWFECDCGKGTYIRAIARDLGEAMGCHGHVGTLRRVSVAPFHEADMVTLEDLQKMADDREALLARVRPLNEALAHVMPQVEVSQADVATLMRGQPVLLKGRDAPVLTGEVCITHEGRAIAIGEGQGATLHPRRVFQY